VSKLFKNLDLLILFVSSVTMFISGWLLESNVVATNLALKLLATGALMAFGAIPMQRLISNINLTGE